MIKAAIFHPNETKPVFVDLLSTYDEEQKQFYPTLASMTSLLGCKYTESLPIGNGQTLVFADSPGKAAWNKNLTTFVSGQGCSVRWNIRGPALLTKINGLDQKDLDCLGATLTADNERRQAYIASFRGQVLCM